MEDILEELQRQGEEAENVTRQFQEMKNREAGLVELCCMLSSKGEIEIVKDEYPRFYAAIQEYVENLEQTNNINYLREKLMKEYVRKAQYISGGMYEE